jgi:hypothetical protein
MPEPVAVKNSNMADANAALKLTPEEQNLYAHHLNNLATGNQVKNADGTYSSVLQAVVQGPGDKFYNIPTIWNGKALDIAAAKKMAAAKGWNHWPAYADDKVADARYMQMHQFMEKDEPPPNPYDELLKGE